MNTTGTSAPDIAIIGGGYAGMAAAMTLAEQGIRCTVFEAGKVLGGRARQINLPELTQPVDNGQHLLLGAYHTTLKLIDSLHPVGTAYLRLPLQLHTHNGLQLKATRLPAPLNTAWALLTAKGISWPERWHAARFLQQSNTAAQGSVSELLAGQPASLRIKLWEPLCLAALNTPPTEASAQIFLNVLHDSLLRRSTDSDLILPRMDLSSLFPVAAGRHILAKGSEVITGQRISAIEPDVHGYRILDRHFRAVILATAPQHLPALLRPHPALHTSLHAVESLSYQSIATVYLQYPPHIRLPQPLTGLLHTHAQWIFDRSHTHDQRGLMAAVCSVPQLSGNALQQAVVHELQQYLDLPARPEWVHTIHEKRATFSCHAALTRPAHRTAWTNFYLAGDITCHNYPATLEAATQSGVQCATQIIRNTKGIS